MCGMILLALLTGCSVSKYEKTTQTLFAMDTVMEVTAYGKHAKSGLESAVKEIVRLDQLLSTGDINSEVFAINDNGGGSLSEDTAYLLERSLELYKDTAGVFDITIYPVMEVWGFTTKEYKVPSDDQLQDALALTGGYGIQYDSAKMELSFAMEGMKIDFGGIAKGYTSDRVINLMKEQGIESGIINLGGNVKTLGTKPDGSLWKVAIQSPDDEGGMLGVVEVADKAVITSGGYERYFEEAGISYHHIIDPQTGYPANHGLKSVTIISEDGTLADALSTSLYIMGKEKAEEYWREASHEFDMVLMTDDKKLYITEGIKDTFSSDYEVFVLKK